MTTAQPDGTAVLLVLEKLHTDGTSTIACVYSIPTWLLSDTLYAIAEAGLVASSWTDTSADLTRSGLDVELDFGHLLRATSGWKVRASAPEATLTPPGLISVAEHVAGYPIFIDIAIAPGT